MNWGKRPKTLPGSGCLAIGTRGTVTRSA
jgi:hypothetical protein